FSRPELFQSKSLRSVKVNLLQVLAEIARPDFDLDLIEQAIARDVSISYKLLRYINSALFNTVNEISTIRHAILLLGRKEFRNFIGLLLTGEIASDKPLELTRVALVRGRFCEQIAIQSGKSKESSEYFLLGLFSLLDAMLDTGMAVVLEKLPLQERLKHALLTDEGELAEYLKLVRAYERGDWQGINDLLELLELGDADSMMCYLDAIAWGDQMVNLKPAD
ncbi:MAG: HDOD domain-containing protein, partial [Pseudomonadales bacterium]|nr:HDOD domain-containing protein [Pseudomonadales bacterium]